MKNILLVLTISLISLVSFGQQYFPAQCEGEWEGKMIMSSQGSPTDTIDVKMKIEAIEDTLGWTWKTVYEAPERTITKDYAIYFDKNSPNRYLLDENNGIILYSYSYGNKMYSNFEVQGSYLTSTYTLEGETLIFEITSGKNIGKTGNDISNFSISFQQISYLKKLQN